MKEFIFVNNGLGDCSSCNQGEEFLGQLSGFLSIVFGNRICCLVEPVHKLDDSSVLFGLHEIGNLVGTMEWIIPHHY